VCDGAGGAFLTRRRPSQKHHHQPSPASKDRIIGCPGFKNQWADACFPKESLQQPTFPHVMHIRRFTQCIPARMHSSQPTLEGVTSTTDHRCSQRVTCRTPRCRALLYGHLMMYSRAPSSHRAIPQHIPPEFCVGHRRRRQARAALVGAARADASAVRSLTSSL